MSSGAGVPTSFSLEQNYPNPFNPTTNIRFSVASSGFVSLQVFDILGRGIATLVGENLNAGRYEATFDANDLPTGVYFYRLQSGNFTEARRLLLLR